MIKYINVMHKYAIFVLILFLLSSCGNTSKREFEGKIYPHYVTYPAIGPNLYDYQLNTLKYGKPQEETAIVKYGINDDWWPNPNIEPLRYTEITEMLVDEPEAILHHCIWETYSIEAWYIKRGDSLIPISGNLHKSIYDRYY